MAKGLANVKATWLSNTKGKGARWKARFASEEAKKDWADKLSAKFEVPASTIAASGMGKAFTKAQTDKVASDFDEMITSDAADRWERNLRRALTQSE